MITQFLPKDQVWKRVWIPGGSVWKRSQEYPPPPVEPHHYRIYYVNIDFPCRWVANVPPRETSPEAKSDEKRPISQATKEEAQQQT